MLLLPLLLLLLLLTTDDATPSRSIQPRSDESTSGFHGIPHTTTSIRYRVRKKTRMRV